MTFLDDLTISYTRSIAFKTVAIAKVGIILFNNFYVHLNIISLDWLIDEYVVWL